jgi:hypothetical protein
MLLYGDRGQDLPSLLSRPNVFVYEYGWTSVRGLYGPGTYDEIVADLPARIQREKDRRVNLRGRSMNYHPGVF